MLSVVLGLLGAAIYGGSDFLGGIAAQRTSAIRVTAYAALAGLVVLLVGLPFIPSQWTAAAIGWGVAAGLVGSGSVALLYACLALGPMSVLTPITALVSAVVPIGVGFVAGERLNALGLIGIAVGLVAVLLICLTRHSESARASVRAVVMGIGAGVCIGLYLVCIDQTTTASGLAPLVVCFVVSVIGMFGVLLVMRLARRGTGAPRGSAGARVMILIVACGVTDAVASMLFLAALRTGELTIVSVLSALSPAGTILLAAIVLRERVARTQVLGLILAAVAAVLLALA